MNAPGIREEIGRFVSKPQIEVVLGDILDEETDAIVSSAQPYLEPTGHGLDRAVRRGAGRVVEAQLRRIREDRFPFGVPTTGCVATSGGALDVRWILHSIVPTSDVHAAVFVLSECFANAAKLAGQLGARSLAIPALGAGGGDFPIDVVAEVAIAALRSIRGGVQTVRFVLFDRSTHAAFVRAFVAST